MKRTTKYVALDVHQASTVASVREESGRVIARSVLPTDGAAITEFVRGMRGAVHVTFEEGTQAQWVHDLLAPLVDRVVVCDRRGAPRQFRPSHHEERLPRQIGAGLRVSSDVGVSSFPCPPSISTRCRSSASPPQAALASVRRRTLPQAGLRPATDLGFLLHKNPARAQSFDVAFGRVHACNPETMSTYLLRFR